MKKFSFATLGCKLNQYESMGIREMMESKGFEFVPFENKADIYIINTCTVTNKSDFHSRQLIRKTLKRNPDAFIIVTGCYPQINSEKIADIDGVDLIVGNQDKFRIADLITEIKKRKKPDIIVESIADTKRFEAIPITRFSGYTRAFVKIQDGCSNYCSYCIVPYVRGPNRSQDKDKVLEQIKLLIDEGYKEIVLTGVHLGTYGMDLNSGINLSSLLKEILSIKGLKRLRLSSIEPTEFTDELIDVISSPNICPHLHIPLQSADGEILKRMQRPYTFRFYQELMENLIKVKQDLSIGTDVIVGFPGEKEDNFQNTLKFIENNPFSYLHVFRFSPRPKTGAEKFPGRVGGEEILRRSEIMRSLSRKKSLDFRNRFIGREIEVLILETRDKETNLLVGLTGNYIKVFFDGSDSLMKQLIRIEITDIEGKYTFGKYNI